MHGFSVVLLDSYATMVTLLTNMTTPFEVEARAVMTEYNTTGLRGADRFAYWRDVICDAYLPIHCDSPDINDFDGRISLQRYGQLNISRVTGSAQHVSRRRREIARDSDSFYMLSVQVSQTSCIKQHGRSAVLRPGDFALYCTSEPYEIICDNAVDQLVFQIPNDKITSRLPHADMLTGMRIDGQSGIGAMVSQNMRDYALSIGDQLPNVQRHLQDMLVDMVVTGLSTVSCARMEISRPKQMLLSRAKSMIRAHMRDHRLDRAHLADLMGMSPRNLARCFELNGTSIAGYIRTARLAAIAADLTNPRMESVSISEISMKWGLTNFQHLSKLFKQTYGLSPRDYRRQNMTR